jgi:ABC-2 type transport system permease protein
MSAEASTETRPLDAARRRLKALIRKETRQLVRDKSSLLVGIVLPLLLILIFGYGLSFDVKHVPIAIVMDDPSPAANDIVSGLYLSPYFTPTPVASFNAARDLMLARKVDGIVTLPADLSRKLAAGDAHVQLIVNGIDANRARVILGFAQAAITQSLAAESNAQPPLSIEARLWFNEANDSSYFPRTRPHRAHHDVDRRIPDGPRRRARMGARHARGAVRDTGALGRDSDQ